MKCKLCLQPEQYGNALALPGCLHHERSGWRHSFYRNKKRAYVHVFPSTRLMNHKPTAKVAGTYLPPRNRTRFQCDGLLFCHFVEPLYRIRSASSVALTVDAVEGWISRELLENYQTYLSTPVHRTCTPCSLCWCTMPLLKPLQNYTIKGFIWYQERSDMESWKHMPNLSRHGCSWRKEWGLGELPFTLPEIAPYALWGYPMQACLPTWSAIPNSGMISNKHDFYVEPYEMYNIHPTNKTKVGQRLGYLALDLTWIKADTLFQPHNYKSMDC